MAGASDTLDPNTFLDLVDISDAGASIPVTDFGSMGAGGASSSTNTTLIILLAAIGIYLLAKG